MKVSEGLIESLCVIESAITTHGARLMAEEVEKLDSLITGLVCDDDVFLYHIWFGFWLRVPEKVYLWVTKKGWFFTMVCCREK